MLIFNGLAPQRADKVKELGDQYGVGTSFAKMVYNGPFVVSEYQQGSKIVYTKNDKYWDAANIKITKADCPIINEPATIFNMFQAKQLDAMGAATKDLVAQLADLSKNGDIYKISGDQCSTFYYIFSFKNKYLANAKVREALSLAFNREETLKVLYDRNIPAYGMVTAGLSLGDKDFRKTNEEPLKKVVAENKDPKAVLMEGLKEFGISDPSQVKLSIYFATATSSSKPLGEYIQKQWNDNLGIKVVLKFAPDTKTYYADRRNGNFDICYGGWGSDYNSVFSMLELFRTGGGNNEGKYSNPKYDELINSSLNETDDSKRMSNFKEAERLLIAEDFAIAPVFYADTHSYAQKYVKGISYPLFCGRYIFRDAYVSGKK
jgi:oligopeptide transport system substrate-binding protein